MYYVVLFIKSIIANLLYSFFYLFLKNGLLHCSQKEKFTTDQQGIQAIPV
jgi:hypothetical protein